MIIRNMLKSYDHTSICKTIPYLQSLQTRERIMSIFLYAFIICLLLESIFLIIVQVVIFRH